VSSLAGHTGVLPPIKVLMEPEIRALITPAEALKAVREAFVALADGRVSMPSPIELDFPHQHADLHVKGAFIHGVPLFSFKVVCGFYENVGRALPITSGAILVFESDTGELRALLFDNGFLTNLRTGAAGALAVDLLAQSDVEQVAIIGAGTQARYQLGALLGVRQPRRVVVYSRTPRHAQEFANEMGGEHGVQVDTVHNAEQACRGAMVVVTTTTAREPVVKGRWLMPGAHVTAVGSDLPAKRELDGDVFASADVVVADLLEQCLQSGEIHHAVATGQLDPKRVIEMGPLAAGREMGRISERQITVADLTGVGIQDVAVANVVAANASREGSIGLELALRR
jgi:ornithine cyclodeaminase/alanine dehydrogenase-like protein (mu-crystallin family)